MRMKLMLALVAGLWSGTACAVDCAPKALHDALIVRKDADQAARKAAIADMSDKAANAHALQVDHDNTAWMREVVAQCQWPKESEVGSDGATAAWLLVQHADMDPEFQVIAARALEAAVFANEADGETLALLVDRNRMLTHLPQVYGTNIEDIVPGQYVRFLTIVNPAGLDARRKAIGLSTFFCHAKDVAEQKHVAIEWPQGVPFVPGACAKDD